MPFHSKKSKKPKKKKAPFRLNPKHPVGKAIKERQGELERIANELLNPPSKKGGK